MFKACTLLTLVVVVCEVDVGSIDEKILLLLICFACLCLWSTHGGLHASSKAVVWI